MKCPKRKLLAKHDAAIIVTGIVNIAMSPARRDLYRDFCQFLSEAGATIPQR